MISDALFEATSVIREYLENPAFKEIYAGELRTRIEGLVVEMDSVRSLPGMDPPPDIETVELRADVLDQICREESRLREDEEAEARAEAIKGVKPKPDDREQQGEPDDDQWPE
jgi:hypothetical protein